MSGDQNDKPKIIKIYYEDIASTNDNKNRRSIIDLAGEDRRNQGAEIERNRPVRDRHRL